MTSGQWATLAGRLMAWFPSAPWSEEIITIWGMELAEEDPVLVEAALIDYRDRGERFPPNLGQVIAGVGRCRRALRSARAIAEAGYPEVAASRLSPRLRPLLQRELTA